VKCESKELHGENLRACFTADRINRIDRTLIGQTWISVLVGWTIDIDMRKVNFPKTHIEMDSVGLEQPYQKHYFTAWMQKLLLMYLIIDERKTALLLSFWHAPRFADISLFTNGIWGGELLHMGTRPLFLVVFPKKLKQPSLAEFTRIRL